MRRSTRLTITAFLFCGLLAVSASGQNITSSIVGQVSDSSAAAVPGVHITITNIRTGISVNAITDSAGTYAIPGLLAGTYQVMAEANGFASYRQTGIDVESAATVRVDITMKVGATSETVNVTASAPLIHADSATIGGTVESRQITDLPAAYQTVSHLFAMIPGTNGGAGSSNPQMSGTTHWGSTNFSLNGVSMNDAHNGGSAYAYGSGDLVLVNLPGLDSLQAFQVESVDSNAEFRDVSSVIMVTKQGSNQFHGDAYEYFQNAALNANSFLLNAQGSPRPQANRNQFGGSIGGPIVKNKAFFFFSTEDYRERTSAVSRITVPSPAMRNGDFSALCSAFSAGVCVKGTQLYNPYTGAPFPNNQIPASMFAPQAKALLSYLPEPNVAGSTGLPNSTPNYITSVPQPKDMNSYVGRGDYQITSSDSLYGVYSHNTGLPWAQYLSGPPQYGNATNYGYQDQSISATETHIFSPTTLNDFRAAWFDHHSFRVGQNQDFDPSSLFPQLTPGKNRGLPTMSAQGYTAMFNDVGFITDTSLYDVEFTDNFTHVAGRHTIKAGFDETGYKEYDRGGRGPLGSFTFTGVWTGNKGWPGQPQSQGNAFADFLLGVANSSTTGGISPDYVLYNRDYEAYIQDTWQVSPRLTVYYGIRYAYQTPWSIRGNQRAFYDIGNNKLALPQDSATPTLPAGASPTLFNTFLPYLETTQSIGLPTNYLEADTNNWAPRFGFAYRPFGSTVIRGGYGVYYNFTIAALQARDSGNIPYTTVGETATSGLRGNPASTYLPDLTFQDPFGNAVASVSLNPAVVYQQRDFKNAVIQQWNLTLERQFGQSWVVRTSYVGSQSHHLPWFNGDINQPLEQIPNETVQQQRPFQPWGAINTIRSGAVQNFHQFQGEAIKRFSGGFSFQVEYSWTRSLDDLESSGGPQRWQYPGLDYGNSTGIRTHTLVFNYLYELPFGTGKPWLNSGNRFLNAVAGGWEVSGITTYASGTPFSVAFQVPSSYVGWAGGRADQVASVPVYERQSGHDVIDGVQWFNPAAFGAPQPWTWGNTGRNILWGPGLWNWDLSALKNFSLWDKERLNMTIRGDFIDGFNHFNLGNPSATVASTQYGGIAEPNAGKITGGSGSRIIQVGLRISF